MILYSDHAFLGCWGNLQIAVVGELGSDDATFPCYLLVTIFHLPFANWLSLVLAGVAVSDFG